MHRHNATLLVSGVGVWFDKVDQLVQCTYVWREAVGWWFVPYALIWYVLSTFNPPKTAQNTVSQALTPSEIF